MTHRIEVLAVVGRKPRLLAQVDLPDDPVAAVAVLADGYLSPKSPLSRAFLDGAGMKYRPVGIAVLLNGRLLWADGCHDAQTPTDTYVPSRHRCKEDQPFTLFADAYGEECWPGYDAQGNRVDDDRLAGNRAAYELLRNDPVESHWTEDVADDLIDAAGWLRPSLRPTRSVDSPARPIDPDPSPRYGDTTSDIGLPYKPIRQVRGRKNGVEGTETLVGHEFRVV